jgi:hypothetical protein
MQLGNAEMNSTAEEVGFSWRRRLAGGLVGIHEAQTRWRDAGVTRIAGFYGHCAPERGVGRLIHVAHYARADWCGDLV